MPKKIYFVQNNIGSTYDCVKIQQQHANINLQSSQISVLSEHVLLLVSLLRCEESKNVEQLSLISQGWVVTALVLLAWLVKKWGN